MLENFGLRSLILSLSTELRGLLLFEIILFHLLILLTDCWCRPGSGDEGLKSNKRMIQVAVQLLSSLLIRFVEINLSLLWQLRSLRLLVMITNSHLLRRHIDRSHLWLILAVGLAWVRLLWLLLLLFKCHMRSIKEHLSWEYRVRICLCCGTSWRRKVLAESLVVIVLLLKLMLLVVLEGFIVPVLGFRLMTNWDHEVVHHQLHTSLLTLHWLIKTVVIITRYGCRPLCLIRHLSVYRLRISTCKTNCRGIVWWALSWWKLLVEGTHWELRSVNDCGCLWINTRYVDISISFIIIVPSKEVFNELRMHRTGSIVLICIFAVFVRSSNTLFHTSISQSILLFSSFSS